MTRRIVVLSGRIASGKSSLAEALHLRYGATVVGTRKLLEAEASRRGVKLNSTRRALQEFGTQLDRDTKGEWIVAALLPQLQELDHDHIVVIDSVRLAEQLEALRREFGRTVVHVHVTAFESDLQHRFETRGAPRDGQISYDEASHDLTERQVETLGPLADLTINTSVTDMNDAVIRCAAKIGLLPPLDSQLVDVLVGGQYGSEGKGNIAYFLAPEYDVLVRVGGPNAGHKVPTQPVVTHRTLPSGSISNPRARILIGAGAVVSVPILEQEIKDSGIDPSRVRIDPQAMVISPGDVRAERALKKAIGSTGQGVGSALARKINGRVDKRIKLARDVPALKEFVHEPVVQLLEKSFSVGSKVLLEGTQGTGLSMHHGQYPYVTSRDTTAAGCLSEAGIGVHRVRKIIMVVRSYPIRVQGPSGPIGTELAWEEIARRSGMDLAELKESEKSSVQKKLRRVAEFDWKSLRFNAELNTPTDIALTFADYLNKSNSNAYRYDQLHEETRQFIEEIEAVTSSPVSLVSGRFTDRSVIDRRTWRGSVSYDAKE